MVVGLSSGKGRVPSALPSILKNYTKAAIRTQPSDLVAWSYAYFKALTEGESPPVKDQIEYPLPQTESGITPGVLRVLHKKFANMDTVPKKKFLKLCNYMGINEEIATSAFDSASDGQEANWDELLVKLSASDNQTQKEQVVVIMTALSDDIVTKKVPVDTALKYLDMVLSSDSSNIQTETKEFLRDVASYQDNQLFPSDFSRNACPLN